MINVEDYDFSHLTEEDCIRFAKAYLSVLEEYVEVLKLNKELQENINKLGNDTK